MLIIGALLAFGLLVLASEWKWVKRTLMPHLSKIMLGSLVLLLVFMVIQKPEHMMKSAYINVLNLFRFGRWGITWLIFSLLFIFSATGPRVPKGESLFYTIISFYGLLLAIAYFRNPYRIGWYDSANRMLTHILPIVVLYVLMKAARGLSKQESLDDAGD